MLDIGKRPKSEKRAFFKRNDGEFFDKEELSKVLEDFGDIVDLALNLFVRMEK